METQAEREQRAELADLLGETLGLAVLGAMYLLVALLTAALVGPAALLLGTKALLRMLRRALGFKQKDGRM